MFAFVHKVISIYYDSTGIERADWNESNRPNFATYVSVVERIEITFTEYVADVSSAPFSAALSWPSCVR